MAGFLSDLQIWLYTTSEQMSDRAPIRRLIDLQRRLLDSRNLLVRSFGSLFGAAGLDRNLCELRDRQIGQLMKDVVERDLTIASPESVICRQASRRLIRSTAGRLEEMVPESQPCPECGRDMIAYVGIDDPDYWECSALDCHHRECANTEGDDEL